MLYRKPKIKGDFHWALIFFTGGMILKFWRFFSRHANRQSLKINLLDFAKEEKREAFELFKGKENIKTYCHDAGSIFEDYFIPYQGNAHKPKFLRTRSLGIIITILILLKLSLTLWLFFLYSDTARMKVEISTETLGLINADRASANAPALKEDVFLSASAMEKAKDMIDLGYFSHQSPNGFWPWDWIDRAKYPYLYVGENLAMNFTTAESANNALMASPSHKKNILNERYRNVGIAVLTGELQGKKTTVMVQLFGTREEAKIASKPAPAAPIARAAPIPSAIKPAPSRSVIAKDIKKPSGNTVIAGIETKNAAVAKFEQAQKPEIKPIKVKIADPVDAESEKLSAATTTPSLPVAVLLGINGNKALPETLAASPNPELESAPASAPIISAPKDDLKFSITRNMIEGARMAYFWMLAMLVVALMLNLFVRITIQHKPVIIRALVVILLIAGMLALKVHLLEYIGSYIAVV
jgi:hypothetical protein